jgi:uncharacterized membrane protein
MMPISDVLIVARWWGALFLVGAAAFPITTLVFPAWHDRGYLFSKAVGMAVVSWVIFVASMAHIVPFSSISIALSLGAVFLFGAVLHMNTKKYGYGGRLSLIIFFEEMFFFVALLFWTWIKAHEPSIRGLEKFMDYGFMNSILHTRYFPPPDMWFPPASINYYYFGHLVTAVLTKLSGIDLSYTFNLMLSTIFALCLTMSFSIGKQISRMSHMRPMGQLGSGILTAFLVTLAGNMQTIYAFTEGYSGDQVQPFWNILWPLQEFTARVQDGMTRYWYANATRFIPYTIHEFPSYSFVVSDVHGHVLSIPFVLLAMGLLIGMFGLAYSNKKKHESFESWVQLIFYGFLCGVLLMTNALDGPIYMGLFLVLLLVFYPGDWMSVSYWKKWGRQVIPVIAAAGVSSLPFLVHFKSFVNGLAVDCPPAFLANSKIGPILFETVDKCQKSPFWMMYLLWGFFWFCGVWFIVTKSRQQGTKQHAYSIGKRITHVWNTNFTQLEKVLVLWFFFCTLLIIFPEFFYFKDIYPMHFRSNTMFKLGYQAFIMYSIISAYVICGALRSLKTSFLSKLFVLLVLPQFFLVSIYPWFSVRSYFGNVERYEGIGGLSWLAREFPDNYNAIVWLNRENSRLTGDAAKPGVIVEADGDSYTDYEQFSVFTGMPTVIGWSVHEWLWRGTYDIVSPRKTEVQQVYEGENIPVTAATLQKYHVRYIIVGQLERQKYPKLLESKLMTLGKIVFQSGTTTIYQVL